MNQLEKINHNLFSDFIKDLAFSDYLIKPLYSKYVPENINVDISETPTEFKIQAEIPGVKKEEINVQVEGDTVTISAEVKKEEEEKKDETVVKCERFYGFTSRKMQLTSDVDADKTTAQYQDGVLTLTLPKVTSDAVRRIAIN
jgi:HSP20 family protein